MEINKIEIIKRKPKVCPLTGKEITRCALLKHYPGPTGKIDRPIEVFCPYQLKTKPRCKIERQKLTEQKTNLSSV